MATPPFTIATTSPGDTDVESAFPAVERTFRDTVNSWLLLISDSTTGLPRAVSTDSGASQGPLFDIFRDSISPAASDLIGGVALTGRNSAAAKVTYASVYGQIADPVAATEDGVLYIQALVNGTPTSLGIFQGNGIQLNAPLSTNSTFSAGGSITVTGSFISSTVNAIMGTTGAGGVFLRPNGVASATGQLQVASTGAVTAAGAVTVTSGGLTLSAGNLSVTGDGSITGNVTISGTSTTNSFHKVTGTGLHIFQTDYSMTDAFAGLSLYTSDPIINVGRSAGAALQVKRRTSDGACTNFFRQETNVGNIALTAAATAYNTSSDKRRKTDWKTFDAGPVLDALEVWDFAWKATGQRAFGVLAQDAAKVFPDAVTYDAKLDFWSADYSKFVPLLIKEVQSLRSRVAELEGESHVD
jgi:hypothetical protein